MSGLTRAGMVVLVSHRIVCEVETVGDSLTGRVSVDGGRTHEFTGWLGLLGVLQDLLAGAEPTADGTTEP